MTETKTEQLGDKTLSLELHVRNITEEQAKEIDRAIATAVVGVIGRLPNGTTHSLEPDWTPSLAASSEEEAE